MFHTARKGHVHCSSACNTRAWRQRKPAAAPSTLAGPTAPSSTPASAAGPTTLAFSGRNVGTIALGTAAGNLLSEGVKKLFASPARAASPGATFPTWPPAALLAAAQTPQWLSGSAWAGQLWLTPTTHHGHLLYLYAEAGLPYVLWQSPRGTWRLLTTPAELAELATHRPLSPGIQVLQQQYGLLGDELAIGTPLPLQLPPAQPQRN